LIEARAETSDIRVGFEVAGTNVPDPVARDVEENEMFELTVVVQSEANVAQLVV
jgi:hypothetical protein